MVEASFLVMVLFLMAAFGLLLTRELLYPPVIQAVVWLLALGVYLLQPPGRYFDVDPAVVWLIFAAVVAYGVGSFGIWYPVRRTLQRSTQLMRRERALPPLTGSRYRLFVLLSLGSLAVAALFIRTSIQFAHTGPTENLFLNLRYLLTGENAVRPALLKLTSYIVPFLNALAGYALIYLRFTAQRDWRMIFLTVLLAATAVTAGIFSTGRGILLLFILELSVIFLLTSKRFNISAVFWGIAAFFGVFFTGAVLLAKGGVDSGNSLAENISSLLDSVSFYLISGILALSVTLPTIHFDFDGTTVFRTVYAALSRFGYSVTPAPLIQPYVNVPDPTNVYTSFLPYLQDYGMLGVVIFQVLFGMIQTAFFVLYLRRRSAVGLFMTSVLTFATLTQPFTDSYMSLLSTWAQYLIFSVVLNQILFGKPRVNRRAVRRARVA